MTTFSHKTPTLKSEEQCHSYTFRTINHSRMLSQLSGFKLYDLQIRPFRVFLDLILSQLSFEFADRFPVRSDPLRALS